MGGFILEIILGFLLVVVLMVLAYYVLYRVLCASLRDGIQDALQDMGITSFHQIENFRPMESQSADPLPQNQQGVFGQAMDRLKMNVTEFIFEPEPTGATEEEQVMEPPEVREYIPSNEHGLFLEWGRAPEFDGGSSAQPYAILPGETPVQTPQTPQTPSVFDYVPEEPPLLNSAAKLAGSVEQVQNAAEAISLIKTNAHLMSRIQYDHALGAAQRLQEAQQHGATPGPGDWRQVADILRWQVYE